MSHEVKWNKYIYETFSSELKNEILDERLLEELQLVLKTRLSGMARTEQSIQLKMGIATIDRRIKLLKVLYDEIQSTRPELKLPKRRRSKEEKWMDSH